MKLGHLAIITGAFASLLIHGCAEPGGIVSVTPPGAVVPKVSPDTDPSQALGEAASSLGGSSAKAAGADAVVAKEAELKATETKPAQPKPAETKPTATASTVSATPIKSEVKTSPKGVKYEILKEGSGPEAKAGDQVLVHYVGTLENGRQFDSSRPRNRPFPVVLGAKQVIAGWDDGIPGMKAGELRRLTIPSDLGYGARGFPPDIPAGATLIFEVELLKIN